MKSNIFVPKRINVGFQERSDTYTKKLAYVIYFDNKGILRKEASWNSWRDDKIDPIEYTNEPTSGFVLNKKVGDYASDWNHRQAYVRVYDPRDFEFEITIENLLYILENTSSIKGKGLEGDFVYAWDGKDLILLPTSSPDYASIEEYNDKIHSNNFVKAKDLIIGATYRTKQNEEWIYMGRFDYWTTKSERVEIPQKHYSYYSSYNYIYHNVNKGKYYYFSVNRKYNYSDDVHQYFETMKSLGDKFIDAVSEECVSDYAKLFQTLESSTMYSPYDETKDEYITYNYEEFIDKYDQSKQRWGSSITILDSDHNEIYLSYNRNNQTYYYYQDNNNYWSQRKEVNVGLISDVYNAYHPVYKNKYLTNGKFNGKEY